MPNQLTSTGLEVATYSEMQTTLETGFQTIYGNDINLDPDSPDGQIIGIFLQAYLDILDLIVNVYNMFDPDNAIGSVLDQRVSINGIQRQAGTFTTTDVTLVVSQALNLSGLDQTANPVYTVQDDAGNQWQLQTSQVIAGAGTYVFLFQAAAPGQVFTVPDTITQSVTVVLGVTSINNPTTYSTLGEEEESDAALKVRRQQSVSLSSQGYYNGLKAALLNINGVTSVQIIENDSGTTNIYGVPGHSIWVIVAGSGAAASIAQAIYSKRNAGCGMYNSGDGAAQSFTITQQDGSTFTVYWDGIIDENLFIKFSVTSLNSINPPNIAAIQAGLVESFVPGVFQEVNINALATAVQAIDPNTLVTSAGFSTTSGGSYTNTLTPTLPNYQFVVAAADIIITPMQLIPATSTVVPTTGTVAFQGLGGFGTLTYTISTNNSGGSINSSTGVYTAGSTPNVTDTVTVMDSLSNTATAMVVVT